MDEKNFFTKYKKTFDIVLCRAVFTPPKIFDIFKKFTKKYALWQYSQNYQSILQKFHSKIAQNKLIIHNIYQYQLDNQQYFTVVLKKIQ